MHPFYRPGPPRSRQPIPQPQYKHPIHVYAQPHHVHSPPVFAQQQYTPTHEPPHHQIAPPTPIYGPPHHQVALPTPTYGAPQHQVAPPSSSSNPFDEKIKGTLELCKSKLRDAISRSPCSVEERKDLTQSVEDLRIHRHLFLHAYDHLLHCCRQRPREELNQRMKAWITSSGLRQLTHYQEIKDDLFRILMLPDETTRRQCDRHGCVRNFATSLVIDEDYKELLYRLLFYGRMQEAKFYDLLKTNPNGSKQIIELISKLLDHRQEGDVTSRLRAHIYRMSRKCTHIPSSLNIQPPQIVRTVANGAHAVIRIGRFPYDTSRREVAIKTMRTEGGKALEFKKIIVSEAIHWHTLRHENIVELIGITNYQDAIGLVMPFFKNGNVRDYLRGHVGANKHSLALDIARALEYIHGEKPSIFHGDLKGDNVLVRDNGHACIGDFGFSYASDSRKQLDSSSVGSARGSLNWAAPEFLVGETVKVTDKSDIYAFGCILYEMISGKIPFYQYNGAGPIAAAIEKGERPKKPQKVSPDDGHLWEQAKWCWEMRPEKRPSARRLIRALGGH